MRHVEERLRTAAAETRRTAERHRPGRVPVRERQRPKGLLVAAGVFVLVLGLFGVLPLLVDAPSEDQPLGSAPPVAETTSPPTTQAAQPVCSSSEGPFPEADTTLPNMVESTRESLIEYAVACDFDGLAAVAGETLITDFAGGGAANLAAWEGEGAQALGTLLTLFDMSHGVIDDGQGGQIFVWPAAHAYRSWDEIPADAVAELSALYTSDEIQLMEESGGYLGWRTGIDDDGHWLFFVAGD